MRHTRVFLNLSFRQLNHPGLGLLFVITGSRQDLLLRFLFLYIHYSFSLCLYSITHLRATGLVQKRLVQTEMVTFTNFLLPLTYEGDCHTSQINQLRLSQYGNVKFYPGMKNWYSIPQQNEQNRIKPFPSVVLLWWHMVDSCIIKMY